MEIPLSCPPDRAYGQEEWHGTHTGYKRCGRAYGVACSACKHAWSQHAMERRKRYAGTAPELNNHLDHGSPWTVSNYGCHCVPCRDAYNAYKRGQVAARKAARS